MGNVASDDLVYTNPPIFLTTVVNDYRGILQRPNLFFQEWTAPFPKDLLSIYSKSLNAPSNIRGLAMYSGAHPISAGTELCVSYGKGWWAARNGK